MKPIIQVKDVYYKYTNQQDELTAALDGVSLSIHEGEFVAIIGHNGSGKSTLAKHFNALLQPASGDVYVKGMNTKDEEQVWSIRQVAGMVFQNPDNQLVATIVEEDVAFGPENLGLPPGEIRLRVDRALESVRMSDFAQSAPHYLSGGQKQRIAIAGVIAMRPEIIILDNPQPSGSFRPQRGHGYVHYRTNMRNYHRPYYTLRKRHSSRRVVVMEEERLFWTVRQRSISSGETLNKSAWTFHRWWNGF